ncbi:hypothetical protein L1286_09670 [Pseudoalteromonas sp. SMS1]|uniref:hypothetical protein n=1 Tax=Pseudoalteromonas sp. SMS1 TaxID=2908894 RepID=UPI001F1938C2|nr:hypothetical protein [Pseudoalteromonas sp. SMS1]MCF2857739.1 hypothetical protein [Pseudoalteromonas sp. SMS1]
MYKGLASAVLLLTGCLIWGAFSDVCANGLKYYTVISSEQGTFSPRSTIDKLLDEPQENYLVINKTSTNAEKALLKNHQYISQAYIEFDIRRIKQLKKHDTIAFYVPQLQRSFIISISDTRNEKLGNLSVFGHLLDDLQKRTVLELKLSGLSVSGRFKTQSGEYLFRSHAQYGWIASEYEGHRRYLKYPQTKQPLDTFARK